MGGLFSGAGAFAPTGGGGMGPNAAAGGYGYGYDPSTDPSNIGTDVQTNPLNTAPAAMGSSPVDPGSATGTDQQGGGQQPIAPSTVESSIGSLGNLLSQIQPAQRDQGQATTQQAPGWFTATPPSQVPRPQVSAQTAQDWLSQPQQPAATAAAPAAQPAAAAPAAPPAAQDTAAAAPAAPAAATPTTGAGAGAGAPAAAATPETQTPSAATDPNVDPQTGQRKRQPNILQALSDLLLHGPAKFAQDLSSMSKQAGSAYGTTEPDRPRAVPGYRGPQDITEAAAEQPKAGQPAAEQPNVSRETPGQPPAGATAALTPPGATLAPATAGAPGGQSFEQWRDFQLRNSDPETRRMYLENQARGGGATAPGQTVAPGQTASLGPQAISQPPGGQPTPDGGRAPTNGMPGGTTPFAAPATPGYGALQDQTGRMMQRGQRGTNHYEGTITLPDGSKYRYGTGGGQFASAPYGTYYVHPGAVGSVGKSIGAWAGYSDSNRPGDNTVHDPLYRGAGGTHARSGVEIHPDVSGRRLITNGCIGIDRGQSAAFGRSFRTAAATGRPMIMTIRPNGDASITYADVAPATAAVNEGTVPPGVRSLNVDPRWARFGVPAM